MYGNGMLLLMVFYMLFVAAKHIKRPRDSTSKWEHNISLAEAPFPTNGYTKQLQTWSSFQ